LRKLVFHEVASAELRAIGNSTRARWGDRQASVYVAELRESIKSLRELPLRFPELGPERPGLRRMRCGGHVVSYLVTDEQIEIVRILHERMDFKTRLG
jgi:toxin ParE1/3/4